MQKEIKSMNSNHEIEGFQLMSDEKTFRFHQFVKSMQRWIQLSDIGLEISLDQLGLRPKTDGERILNESFRVVRPGSLLTMMNASGTGKYK